jgi:hypothetical protein
MPAHRVSTRHRTAHIGFDVVADIAAVPRHALCRPGYAALTGEHFAQMTVIADVIAV